MIKKKVAKGAAKVLGASTAVIASATVAGAAGAAAGAGVGALIGGVGAVPGAVIGVTVGFGLGGTIAGLAFAELFKEGYADIRAGIKGSKSKAGFITQPAANAASFSLAPSSSASDSQSTLETNTYGDFFGNSWVSAAKCDLPQSTNVEGTSNDAITSL